MDDHAKLNWDLATETNTTTSSSSSSNHTSDSTMPLANDPFSDNQRTRVLERNRAAGNGDQGGSFGAHTDRILL